MCANSHRLDISEAEGDDLLNVAQVTARSVNKTPTVMLRNGDEL